MRKYRLKLQTLSPVHIGTGKEILAYEYVLDLSSKSPEKDFLVVDFLRLAAQDEDLVERLLQRQERPSDVNYLRNKNLVLYKGRIRQEVCELLRQVKGNRANVWEFIKDFGYRPYIPGSSIKGGIRTGLAYSLLAENPDLRRKVIDKVLYQGELNAVEEVVFRGGANSVHADILRYLEVADTQPFRKDGTLAIGLGLRLKPREKLPFKNYYEVLTRGQSTTFSITLYDEFLDKGDFRENAVSQLLPRDFSSLAFQVNTFAKEIIEVELKYFRNCQADSSIGTLIGFYKGLLGNIENALSHKQEVMYLCIGKGAGWHKKTIGILLQKENPEEFDRIYRSYKLNRRDGIASSKFPLTREVICEWSGRNVKKMSALGWVKITKI